MPSFKTLPPEIREKIFGPCLDVWIGETPELLKALRPEPILYNQALDLFYRQNTFVLGKRNAWSMEGMSEETIKSLEKIELLLE